MSIVETIDLDVGGGRKIPFRCPHSTGRFQQMVFEGEYAFNLPEHPRRILDIGANCGAFSLWAAVNWPAAHITAYEPAAEIFSLLVENVKPFPSVTPLHFAVLASDQERLYKGKLNAGEASFYLRDQCSEDFEVPPRILPAHLPACDLLKADTEGCECEIISGYVAHVCKPQLIMFEYHSEADRIWLDEFLVGQGYDLAGGHIACVSRGTLKYLRRAA